MIYSRAMATSGSPPSPLPEAQQGCFHSAEWTPTPPPTDLSLFSTNAGMYRSDGGRSYNESGHGWRKHPAVIQ